MGVFLKKVKMKFIVISTVLMGLLLTGCAPDIKAEKTIRYVSIQTVGQGDAKQAEGVTGNIVPVETVKVSFKIDGVIESIYVKEGDYVKKGDVIAKIKPKDYELGLEASKAQYESAQMSIDKDIPNKLAQAKAQLDLTQVNYERIKVLYEQGAVAKEQFDQISTKLTVDKSIYQQALDAYDIASTQLGQAKAAYELSSDNLKETTVYSPMDGIVLKKLSSDGEVQGAGYPVAVIGKVSEVWAEFGITDSQIGQFQLGQKWPVYIYGINEEKQGIVSEIGATADEKTRLFTVRLKLDNNGAIKPGMIAKASFNKTENKKLLIPFLSVVHLSEGDIVYVYDNSKKMVFSRKVQTGNVIDDRIEVIKGLSAGEQIVVEGQYQISDKEQVTVND